VKRNKLGHRDNKRNFGRNGIFNGGSRMLSGYKYSRSVWFQLLGRFSDCGK